MSRASAIFVTLVVGFAAIVVIDGLRPRDEPPVPTSVCHLTSAPKYVAQTYERQDYGNVPRMTVRVTVPPELSEDELQANLCQAALDAYDGAGVRLGAVMILGYSGSDISGAYNAGQAVFAPDGKWDLADPSFSRNRWRIAIGLADAYFDTEKVLSNGTSVTLVGDDDKQVFLSNSAERWTDAEIIAKAPIGSKAIVLGHQVFNMGPSPKVIRYQIAIMSPPHAHGWVHSRNVRVSP